jgi:hypothetical protein
MNKSLKFGYDALGAYSLVKINAKLTDYESARLEALYYNWLKFIPNQKGLTRIEGVMPVDCLHDFTKDLRIAILRSKMTVMQEEVYGLMYPKAPVSTDLDWTMADLDKI